MLPRSLAPPLDLKWENSGSELAGICWTSPKCSCSGDLKSPQHRPLESLKTHRTVLELLKLPTRRESFGQEFVCLVGLCSVIKKCSKWNAAALQVIPAAPSVCRMAPSYPDLLTTRQNIYFFPPWNQRRGSGALWACVHSMSDAPDSLPAAVGCYMQRHALTCWKLPVARIFSGFQKPFQRAERQHWILLLAGLWLDVKEDSYESSGAAPCSPKHMWMEILEQMAPLGLPNPTTAVAFVSWYFFFFFYRLHKLGLCPLSGPDDKWYGRICINTEDLTVLQHNTNG